MENLPSVIGITFVCTCILTIALFIKAAHKSKPVLFFLLGWMTIHGIIGTTDFLKQTNALPPHLALMVFPAILFIALLFLIPAGKNFIDALDVKWLTILHIVRIPVELVLFWLSLHKMVPEIMTFEGFNFDILSGLSAPIVFYLVFNKNILGKNFLLLWNIISLGLLFNIVIIAVLSAPFPFQQFGLAQPNIAVLYFPFNWLPTLVVPLVLFSHLASIRQLTGHAKA